MTTTTCDDAGQSRSKANEEPLSFHAMALRASKLVAAILLGFAAFFMTFQVAAAGNLARAFSKIDEAKSGSLLIKREDGGFADANRLGIDVDLTVSGPTVRARVTQIFRNPTQEWVEAIYVYPLPEGSAVDTLKMVIGDRVVVGDIKEREKARAVVRRGAARGQEGGADRTGAAEHLHQLGRQHRPGRDRAGADRIPGAGEAGRRQVLAAGADGGGPALQSEAGGADGGSSRATAKAGAGRRRTRCRTVRGSRRPCWTRRCMRP